MNGNRTNNRILHITPLLAALLACVGLVACGEPDDAAVGANGSDRVIAQADRQPSTTPMPPPATTTPADRGAMGTSPAAGPAGTGMNDRAADAPNESRSAGQGARDAADTVGDKVDDAVITTKVNGELAKDADLSALQIDVDTSNGRVTLHGTAPDAAARDRAGELASQVEGVTAVDNALTLEKK